MKYQKQHELFYREIKYRRPGGFKRLFLISEKKEEGSQDSPPPDLRRPVVYGSYHLKIFHVNDLHHHLPAENRDEPGQAGEARYSPLARIGAAVNRERSSIEEGKAEGIIFLSAGDDHIGSPLDALTGDSADDFIMSPVYRVLSAAGLDVSVLGNHDFDLPVPVLNRAIAEDADFPVLSANIRVPGGRYGSALIGLTAGIRVGIIGLTGLEELHIREDSEGGIQFEAPEKALERVLPWIDPYCDLLVFLSHLGFNEEGSLHTVAYDDRKLAAAVASATETPAIIIGGHTHSLLDHSTSPVVEAGIPIFQAGANGEYFGRIELEMRVGPTVAMHCRGALYRTAEYPPEPPFETAFIEKHIKPAADMLEKKMKAVLCRVHTDGSADTETTMEDRLSGESAVLNALTDLLAASWNKLPSLSDLPQNDISGVLAACDAPGIQGGFNQNCDITVGDLYRILPYADTLFHGVISGADLKALLRSNARRIIPSENLVSHGGLVGLNDWSHIARGFLQFSGALRYEIDFRGDDPKISVCTIDEVPLEQRLNERFLFLLNSHAALGYQGWGADRRPLFFDMGSCDISSLGFSDSSVPLRKVLIDALGRLDHFEVRRDGRLRILT